MFQELKFLARRHSRNVVTTPQNNYVKLIIRRPEKSTMLVFRTKPPKEIRRSLRTYNYKWNRKHGYWYAYLSHHKIHQIRRIFTLLKKQE